MLNRYVSTGETTSSPYNMGSITCEICWKMGILEPRHGCRIHSQRHCGHVHVPHISACDMCIPWTLAGYWKDRVDCFIGYTVSDTNIPLQSDPRTISRFSNRSGWWTCKQCEHVFRARISSVTLGSWCPYCAGKKLCTSHECVPCTLRSTHGLDMPDRIGETSFVVGHSTHPVLSETGGPFTPRDIHVNSNRQWYFQCGICMHVFQKRMSSVTRGSRHNEHSAGCPFCVRRRPCGNIKCKTCAHRCDVCLSRTARVRTRSRRIHCCRQCLQYVIAFDPNEAPVILRARVSLEIYTLADMQRGAIERWGRCAIWAHPTQWDCTIFPGLSFRPDHIWCFQRNGEEYVLMDRTGAMDADKFAYIMVLEVIEESMESHTRSRNITDADRELAIRNSLPRVPFGFVYVVVAHSMHTNASNDNVFFTRNRGSIHAEYNVIESKMSIWNDRVNILLSTLNDMYAIKSVKTSVIDVIGSIRQL
jgi:hypothetical protein